MSKPLDIYQKKLLELLKLEDDGLSGLTLREIGERIGIDYVQGVVIARIAGQPSVTKALMS